jgi:hypothetical protein
MAALADLPAPSDVSRALSVPEHALSIPASQETLSDLIADMLEVQCVTDAATGSIARSFAELGTFPEVVVRFAIREVVLTFDHAGRPASPAVIFSACHRQGRRLQRSGASSIRSSGASSGCRSLPAAVGTLTPCRFRDLPGRAAKSGRPNPRDRIAAGGHQRRLQLDFAPAQPRLGCCRM